MGRKQISIVLAGLLFAACGGDSGSLEITEERVGQPTGPNAALYFTVTNDGDANDVLIGASTEMADRVELHETTMGDDGTMGMQAIESLRIPAGETVVLEPGGYHLMLINSERMDLGDSVEVVLSWESAGDMTIEAEVVDPADTMGDMDHGDMDDEGEDG